MTGQAEMASGGGVVIGGDRGAAVGTDLIYSTRRSLCGAAPGILCRRQIGIGGNRLDLAGKCFRLRRRLSGLCPLEPATSSIGFRASYKPIMSMTRPTEIHFVLDIMRVYTMTWLAEGGAAVDRTTRMIEDGGLARRFSPDEEAGLTFCLSFGLLEWSATIWTARFLRQAVQATLILSLAQFAEMELGLPDREQRIGPE